MTSPDNNLEFLIAKATDPFTTDANQHSEYVSRICAQIEEDFEGPFVAMKLLSYKMLSPNQHESLHSLEVMEAVVNRGGLRCANELGKYKFLNQFIRLLSSKYQGNQTAENVKKKAIELLYAWSQSFRHLDKLRQVYESLKKEKIIESDPLLNNVNIPKLNTREQRVCALADEEKEKLLSQLLKSKNPDDLQAANRMIKTMVRTEENKFETEKKRNELMETSKTKSGLLSDLMNAAEQDTRSADITLMYELFESLIQLRPKLFHLAAEAAEKNDERMAEILALNDDLNQVVQRYKGNFEEYVTEQRKKVGEHVHVNNAQMTEPCLIDGFDDNDTKMKDITDKISATKVTNDPQSSSDISELLDFSMPSTSNKVTGSQQSLKTNQDDLESLLSSTPSVTVQKSENNHTAENDNFLLKDVHINLDLITFLSNQLVVFCDKPVVKGILYLIKPNTPINDSIVCALATLTFTSTQSLSNVTLYLSSKSPLVTYRNVDVQKHTIAAINPLKPIPTINQVFLLLPLAQGLSNIELEYQLTSDAFNYTGSFTLQI
ncbi:unnamed protein product [Bursaphelenchus okinawaensis]|uniref:VHS domain-containing protein n=1 Tax=Bursaphelenchus okinawaensis TaxID=465554 RepID=A0A811KL08_9BILA|nr:unnamed protein product [Bursaphelenchus okinawaensis]CAG9105396.1 unnamed protein product [Bursaphelenchus okinawaensis]